MKIFNWVHRRFNHKEGLAQIAKKSCPTTADDKQFLLEKKGFCSSVFDGWKGGILAIGTFGYDPLKDETQGNDHDVSSYCKQDKEEEEVEELISGLQDSESDDDRDNRQINDYSEEEEDEDVNPLMYAAYAHEYGGLVEMKLQVNDGKKVEEKEFDEYVAMMKMKSSSKTRERTTLAELFSADSDYEEEEEEEEMMMRKKHLQQYSADKSAEEMMTKQKQNDNKNGRASLAKKIIGEDARPAIHKLNRLMRRMLNRKIHPDVVVQVGHHHEVNSSSKVMPKKRHCYNI